jgi:hypothetical protein
MIVGCNHNVNPPNRRNLHPEFDFKCNLRQNFRLIQTSKNEHQAQEIMSLPEISPDLEDLILRRLAETANRNKVIEELCLEHGLHWQDADQLVDDLIQTHKLDITRQQSPFLVLLALDIFIGGVLLMAWNLLGVLNYIWPYFDPNTPDAAGLYWFYMDTFQVMLNFPYATPLFITGLAMIVGSYFGMKDVWASFFDYLDQRRVFSYPASDRSTALETVPGPKPQPGNFSGDSSKSGFVPNEAALEYILDHSQKEPEAQLVEELWFKFGINKPQGYQLVRQVLGRQGTEFSTKTSMTFALLTVAALFTGLVWVFQFIFPLSGYLAAHPRPILNLWHLLLRFRDIAQYVERFPFVFGLFSLGLILLAGGLYGLKDIWPSVFLWKRKL